MTAPTLTPAEMVRDLAADLAICEAAYDGPWAWDNPTGEPFVVNRLIHVYRTFQDEPAHVGITTILGADEDGKRLVLTPENFNEGDEDETRARATFAVLANCRVGWPIALRRALAAEAEVVRLTALLAAAAQHPGAL